MSLFRDDLRLHCIIGGLEVMASECGGEGVVGLLASSVDGSLVLVVGDETTGANECEEATVFNDFGAGSLASGSLSSESEDFLHVGFGWKSGSSC